MNVNYVAKVLTECLCAMKRGNQWSVPTESSTRRASRCASSRGVHRPSSRDSDVDERQTSPGRRRGSTSSQQQHDTAERKVTTGCVKHAVPSKHVSTDKDCTDIDYAPGNKGKYKSTSGRRSRDRSASSSSDSSQSSSEKQRPSSDGRRSRQRHRSSSSSSDSCSRHHRTHRRSSSSADSRKRFRHQIRADSYDGRGCVDTFLAKFECCAEYNGLNSRDKAAHLKCALTGNAATLLEGNVKARGSHASTEALREQSAAREIQVGVKVSTPQA